MVVRYQVRGGTTIPILVMLLSGILRLGPPMAIVVLSRIVNKPPCSVLGNAWPSDINVSTDAFDPDNNGGPTDEIAWLFFAKDTDKNGNDQPGGGGIAYVNVVSSTTSMS